MPNAINPELPLCLRNPLDFSGAHGVRTGDLDFLAALERDICTLIVFDALYGKGVAVVCCIFLLRSLIPRFPLRHQISQLRRARCVLVGFLLLVGGDTLG